MSRWRRELGLGARLAFSGGRGAWGRLALTAVGVGLGVALLLLATSIPRLVEARDERTAARDLMQYAGGPVRRGDRSLLVADGDTTFRTQAIRGWLLQPEGTRPPRPPGVEQVPGPGEMVVSPALERLLRSSDARLLRERLPYRVIGTIGDAGLEGPHERAYYAGADLRAAVAAGEARRIDRIGSESVSDGFPPILWMLVVVTFAVLLMPVAVFIGTALRFGGEQRDRRLAALRLVGADRRMLGRIAAGEALAGALLGLVAGVAVFLLGRRLIARVELAELSVFPADARPAPLLAALIAVAVPATAVAAAIVAQRGAAIEPLGVVRRARPRRRRLWWRLLTPLAGVLLLASQLGADGEPVGELPLLAGVALVLLGVAGLLPWLTEAVVERVRGSSVPLQLAVRRLQLESGSAARVVVGVAVAVAGAIALQTLFSAAESDQRRSTGVDLSRAQAEVSFGADGRAGARRRAEVAAALREVDGVERVVGQALVDFHAPRGDDRSFGSSVTIADCAVLRAQARIGRCRDGEAFVVAAQPAVEGEYDFNAGLRPPRPGERIVLGDGMRWTIPASARRVAPRRGLAGQWGGGVLLTPAAARRLDPPGTLEVLFLKLADGDRDAIERVRNAAFALGLGPDVKQLAAFDESRQFRNVRRGITAGAVTALLLIGASMLVGALEQLRERRRVLAVLVAFGTPRGLLTRSILWQTAIPVALGLALATAAGVALGALIVGIAAEPLRFDVAGIAALVAAGAAVVLLVTALSMPALWRLMRPDGLRAE